MRSALSMAGLLVLVFVVMGFLAFPAAAAPVNYVESVSGDLKWWVFPLTTFNFDIGTNTINGTFGDGDPDGADAFAFTIPTNAHLVSGQVTLTDALGDMTSTAWELWSGTNNPNPSGVFLEELSVLSPGSHQMTSVPLGPGLYSVTPMGYSGFLPASANYTFAFTVVSDLVKITIATIPDGRSFTVDGTPYTTAQTFSWISGSSHTIGTTTPQGSGSTRYTFGNWSDGGAISHTITTPSNATTYTASFTPQGILSTWYVNPANGHEYALWGFGTWIEAYKATPAGAHLVTFSSTAEEEWVWSTFSSLVAPNYSVPAGDRYRFYIGLTDSASYGASQGNWKWITGEPVSYTRWGVGEPSDNGEHYAESIRPGNYWNDLGPNTFGYDTQAIFERDASSNVTLTGNMHVPRYAHTATLLPNGKVLVAGGSSGAPFDNTHNLSSAELYDPATGLWTQTGNMNVPRAWATATLLGNGKVLVSGGTNEIVYALASAELYDAATGAWTLTGSMNEGRVTHQAEILKNGKVIAFGGYQANTGIQLTSTELYDPTTGIWTTVGSMNSKRADFASGVLGDGRVLAAGGITCCGYEPLQSSETYDPNTRTWTLAGNMTVRRGQVKLAVLPDGGALIVGGGFDNPVASAERFAYSTGIWTARAPMSVARILQTYTRLPSGEILIAGGTNSVIKSIKGFEIYNPRTDIWHSPGFLTVAHKLHTATLLQDGRVLVAGGQDETDLPTPSAEVLTFQYQQTTDFNADGKPDILWRNSSTGEAAIWLMDGATPSAGASLGIVADMNWKIAGIADFNSDGKADILWRNSANGQNAVWFMNGTTVTGGAALDTVTDTNWKIVGVIDFNSDGKTDILWRDSVSGQNVVWLMDGMTVTSGDSVATVPDSNWKIVGVADFNGDGKVDILWRHSVSGQNVVWFMNGTAVTGGDSVATVPDGNWKIVGVADFNGDGKVDILWRHSSNGQNVVWFMNGTTVAGGDSVAIVPDCNWKITPEE
jgi:hypothetical protein